MVIIEAGLTSVALEKDGARVVLNHSDGPALFAALHALGYVGTDATIARQVALEEASQAYEQRLQTDRQLVATRAQTAREVAQDRQRARAGLVAMATTVKSA